MPEKVDKPLCAGYIKSVAGCSGGAGPFISGKEKRTMAAKVDESACSGCGVCAATCPVGAITVDGTAKVNADECIDCGACAGECPCSAITVG